MVSFLTPILKIWGFLQICWRIRVSTRVFGESTTKISISKLNFFVMHIV